MPPGAGARPGVWAIVVAGGSGARFGGYKQFSSLCGRPVVEWSLDVSCALCEGTVLVVPDVATSEPAVTAAALRGVTIVTGGATRTESVRAGLAAVPEKAHFVLVHDAARPMASADLWLEVIRAVEGGADAAVPCTPVTDTVKQRQADGRLLTLERALLVASQTPQGFAARALRRAHASGAEATDDAALVESTGGHVVEVAGSPLNIKLTSPVDMRIAEALLARRSQAPAGL